MSAFIETYNAGDAGRRLNDFFTQSPELAGLQPYQERNGALWLSVKTFSSARINYLLGKAAEEMLPPQAVTAIQSLSIGEYPNVVVLKGMPAVEPGNDVPETGFPVSAMTLRAISALLVKRDDGWENACYGRRFNFEVNSGTAAQGMHSDYAIEDDGTAYGDTRPLTNQTYSVLHFHQTNGAPTWFAPYNKSDAKEPADPTRHTPVVAENGDVVIFNNMRVLHGRGEAPLVNGISKTRNFIAINMVGPYELMGAEAVRPVIHPGAAGLNKAPLLVARA